MRNRRRLQLSQELIRTLTLEDIAAVRGGKLSDARCTGICTSGGCSSLIDPCPVTMNCGL
jgi:hypothetical protein